MQLSERLRMNASCVTPGFRLADVGTDHAYVPIALVAERKIPSALAMDVRPGPLARAAGHIREYQMETVIHTRLSDGLKKLGPGEADSVMIAGMGGALIIRILQEGRQVLSSVQELILQPQSEIAEVRRYLAESGYRIVCEKMVCEDRKYYTVMKAIPGKMAYDCSMECRFGRLLLEERNPVLKDYLSGRKGELLKILDQIEEKGKQDARKEEQVRRLREELHDVEDALALYL